MFGNKSVSFTVGLGLVYQEFKLHTVGLGLLNRQTLKEFSWTEFYLEVCKKIDIRLYGCYSMWGKKLKRIEGMYTHIQCLSMAEL